MIVVKSMQFRDHMLHYLDMVARGHRIVITRYKEPIAEIKLPSENSVIKPKRAPFEIKSLKEA